MTDHIIPQLSFAILLSKHGISLDKISQSILSRNANGPPKWIKSRKPIKSDNKNDMLYYIHSNWGLKNKNAYSFNSPQNKINPKNMIFIVSQLINQPIGWVSFSSLVHIQKEGLFPIKNHQEMVQNIGIRTTN